MKKQSIKVTILGCGTSTGVPVITCPCEVCSSTDPYNNRTRSSIMVTDLESGDNLVIDTGADFRQQMLRHKVKKLKYVLYTHTHADHCHGLDDLRAFYFADQKPMHCWIGSRHVQDLKDRFSYVFKEDGYHGTKPQILLHTIETDSFQVGPFSIEMVELPHGHSMSTAFRIGSFVYATDFKTFPENALEKWKGKVKICIASGVGFKEHSTHSSIPETIEVFKKLGVSKGILTHLTHTVDYKKHRGDLASDVSFAYDGMEFTMDL